MPLRISQALEKDVARKNTQAKTTGVKVNSHPAHRGIRGGGITGKTSEEVVDAQKHTMQPAPDDEIPGSPVPQPAQEHGYHEVAIATKSSLSASPEGNVKIVFEEGGKRDVPASPEFDDGCSFIGRVEVKRQIYIEEFSQTQGHVGISGKIEVDLKSIA